MSDESIPLSEKQIAKLEAEIAARDDSTAMESACGEYNCSCHDRLPALCATVRQLITENERLTERLTEEVEGRVAARIEEMNQTAIPPRTWPKPWWG